MRKFCFFNIQLLPVTNSIPEIGKEGYKNIFSLLNTKIKSAHNNNNLKTIALNLRGNHHISFTRMTLLKGYTYGTITKFDDIDKVVNPFNGKTKYSSTRLSSSILKEFQFIFDHEAHVIAIEYNSSLPEIEKIIELIECQLLPIAEINYNEHELKIESISDIQAIKKIDLTKIKLAKIDVTFSNSQDWDNLSDLIQVKLLEEELKEKNIISCTHTEKSSEKSVMALSQYAYLLLALSVKFGSSRISYQDQEQKTQIYESIKSPLLQKISTLGGHELSNKEYRKRILESISKASQLPNLGNIYED